jgi:hypothetical protein
VYKNLELPTWLNTLNHDTPGATGIVHDFIDIAASIGYLYTTFYDGTVYGYSRDEKGLLVEPTNFTIEDVNANTVKLLCSE